VRGQTVRPPRALRNAVKGTAQAHPAVLSRRTDEVCSVLVADQKPPARLRLNLPAGRHAITRLNPAKRPALVLANRGTLGIDQINHRLTSLRGLGCYRLQNLTLSPRRAAYRRAGVDRIMPRRLRLEFVLSLPVYPRGGLSARPTRCIMLIPVPHQRTWSPSCEVAKADADDALIADH